MDHRAVNPSRERQSSESETTFRDDLTDPERVEEGVRAMADDVWAWCEKTGARGRTVTVKVKWQDFQLCTRRRTLAQPVGSRDSLRETGVSLLRSIYPLRTGVRLVGVTVSQFGASGNTHLDLLALEGRGAEASTPDVTVRSPGPTRDGAL